MTIQVIPYNPFWPQMFEVESTLIKQALKDNCLHVHHVGSTAVPGLAAKPRIDVVVVVTNMQGASQDLVNDGYVAKGEINIPFRFYFTKEKEQHGINLHMYEDKNPEIELNLLFRDYLRDNTEARDQYAELKFHLLKQKESHQKNGSRFSGYNLGKDKFIKECLAKAGFKGLCIRSCSHYDEWAAARHFRQKYFFDKVPISDPYTWTFDHKDHAHFVLYQGVDIVGYVHIQLWQDKRAAMRIIVIDELNRNEGVGRYFLKFCERWLKQKNFDLLQIESSPDAYRFYCKYGYQEMLFNDPAGEETHPNDTALGKWL
jgi:GrpB-like predicted nucleotidyltransferase (UPF0157 family)/GNAT superfamily N-acetyltransferase